jgi:D-inositol-3-phosphate glycosyltransferase
MFHTLGRVKNRVLLGHSEKESDFRVDEELSLGRAADAVVAGSEEDRSHLIQGYGVSPERVHIIPGGVDLHLFHPRPRRLARSRVGFGPYPTALFVGRIDPVKGLETLFRALALGGNGCRNGHGLRLALIGGSQGPSPYLRRLKELARTFGISERIEFLGPRLQGELPDYYSAADLCVFPSLYESFGLAALEAMACGAEVVASDTGGFRQTLGPAKCAVLVPPGDARSLAEALHRVLEHPCPRRGLREEVARGFTWERTASRLAALYQGLLDGGPIHG